MATDTSASIFSIHQPPAKRPKSAAERAREYRLRQKAATGANAPLPSLAPLTTLAFPLAAGASAPLPVPAVTPNPLVSSAFPRLALTLSALALGGTGIVMNGMFAMSLGSSDTAAWLFLALGLASDVAALAIPSCAARLWQDGHPGTALAGWMVWATVFAFALLSGLGFASVNISDVTLARSARVTPAVTAANAALADVMAARDRECRGGTGRFCRERETAVTERRAALDVAMRAVAVTGDPQTDALSRVVEWLSVGTLKPTGNDFALFRLCLLALLPQVGGVLLMIGRTA